MHGKSDTDAYRPCVGVMLLNAEGLVFVGSRIDTPGENWQMPQGGIDEGETPREAVLRELEEEVGTREADIIVESTQWYSYDLPVEIAQRIWGGLYRGQTQRWFAMRYRGQDSDIRLDRHKAEFSAWQWVPMVRLPALITPFKRAVYRDVVQEFAHLSGDAESGLASID
jgi:putative (di)nucleoside polyphosphate hydrolase